MTCIVQGFKTKKALREHVAQMNAETFIPSNRHGDFFIEDPSMLAGNRSQYASELREGTEVVVTNHPKRSRFAQVGRRGGKLYVK